MAPTPLAIVLPEAEIAAICRRRRVRRLELFGSGVRGESTPQSDVDLLVEFEPDVRIGFFKFAQLQRELEQAIGRPVDLVSREGLNPVIRDSVLASARVLYAGG